MSNNQNNLLPLPAFYNNFTKANMDELWLIDYQARQTDAIAWMNKFGIKPAASDLQKVCLLIIDAQNSFCLSKGSLFVGGQSGTGAIDDNIRLVEFMYEHLNAITKVVPSLDTHTAMQIFHTKFWIDADGNHPAPATMISKAEVESGKWKVNPSVANDLSQGNYPQLQRWALYYVSEIEKAGKYLLIVWPYHTMLGGADHALVSGVGEACFFHNIARSSQTGFQIKGGNAYTENYSVFQPEVLLGPKGEHIGQKNTAFLELLLNYDKIVIAGQAKSHCVAWTIADLLNEISVKDPTLAKKVYLLEDCTSPVVIPGVMDFTDQGNEAFEKFRKAGMNIVNTVNTDWLYN